MNMPENYVRIFDTTLRDGEQAPGFSMNLDEKIRLAVQLEKLGVDVIEAGFPAASPDDFAAVELIAKTLQKTEICGLARAMESDIKTTWEAIKHAKKPRIHTFIGTSPTHMKFKLKKTPEQIIEMTKFAVTLAKSLCDRVDFSPEDAGRSEREFLVQVIETAIECGADVINIPDTVGYTQPEEFGDLIDYLITNVKNADQAIFSTHCHNDLGLAGANSLAGVKSGARQIECTINGAGERAGNAALEEVVMAMKVRTDFYGLETGIETTELFATSQLLTQLTGQKVQSNKAIVGKNAFAHESGIHQHGMLANRETYEILTPESVGVKKTQLVLGKHSGRAALADRLKTLGYTLEDEKFQEIFLAFKDLADKKKDITDCDLDVLVMGKSHDTDAEKAWEIVSFSVASSSDGVPTATLTLKNKKTGEEKTAEKNGTGMVDAAFQAIREIVGIENTILTHFGIDAVTSGIDAQAVVSLRIETEDGEIFSARVGDTDIVKASIEAYLSALSQV
jgi:2-isopropylmalate synthase